MKLRNVNISKLLPVFMRNDSFNIFLADFLSSIFISASGNLNSLSIWNSINELNEKELDLLAKDFLLEYYSITAPLEQKRVDITAGIKCKFKACNKPVIENVIKTHFNCSNVELKEWFELNLEPHHFVVNIKNPKNYSESELIKIFNSFCRKSSVIDKINIIEEGGEYASSNN